MSPAEPALSLPEGDDWTSGLSKSDLKKYLGSATTLYGTIALSFVIPSEAEGSAVLQMSPGNAKYVAQTELSSRPERSAVERSAVFFCVSRRSKAEWHLQPKTASRPGGPTAKREPSPEGLGMEGDDAERRRCGTAPHGHQPDFGISCRSTTMWTALKFSRPFGTHSHAGRYHTGLKGLHEDQRPGAVKS
jgi:hypothetical protein